MKHILELVAVIIVALSVAILSGCVAIQPFPMAARAGDTITLAIGSLDGATKDNLIVTYTADLDQGNPIDLTQNIRSVFKIYPDPASPVYIDDAGPGSGHFTNEISFWSGHGPWQMVVAIDLPETLQPGEGSISVTLESGIVSPNNSKTTSSTDIRFTVLNSLGGPTVFEFGTDIFSGTSIGNLSRLSQARQAVIRTAPHSGAYPTSSDIGAVEYTLNIQITDEFGNDLTNSVPDSNVRVVLDMQPENLRNQVNLVWIRNESEIKVITMSHVGGLNPERLRFSIIVLDTIADGIVYTLSDSSSIMDIKTYDINGNEVTSLIQELVIQGEQRARTY